MNWNDAADAITPPSAANMVVLLTDAIAAVTRNQSYSINGRTVTRANLAELTEALGHWKQLAAAESNVSPFSFTVFRGI